MHKEISTNATVWLGILSSFFCGCKASSSYRSIIRHEETAKHSLVTLGFLARIQYRTVQYRAEQYSQTTFRS